MLYLLDANTLIDAKNQYYPKDRVPEFWEWLVFHGQEGNVKIPRQIYEELKVKEDELTVWTKRSEVKEALLFAEEAEPDLVSRITYGGYSPNPTDDEIKTMGNNPFLLSYALRDVESRCVVTTEVSRKSKKGRQRENTRCLRYFRNTLHKQFQVYPGAGFPNRPEQVTAAPHSRAAPTDR